MCQLQRRTNRRKRRSRYINTKAQSARYGESRTSTAAAAGLGNDTDRYLLLEECDRRHFSQAVLFIRGSGGEAKRRGASQKEREDEYGLAACSLRIGKCTKTTVIKFTSTYTTVMQNYP